jgi:hypothetical protein
MPYAPAVLDKNSGHKAAHENAAPASCRSLHPEPQSFTPDPQPANPTSFEYEAPGDSSVKRSLCIIPCGDYFTVEIRVFGEGAYGVDAPYLSAETLQVPREQFEFLLEIARQWNCMGATASLSA